MCTYYDGCITYWAKQARILTPLSVYDFGELTICPPDRFSPLLRRWANFNPIVYGSLDRKENGIIKRIRTFAKLNCLREWKSTDAEIVQCSSGRRFWNDSKLLKNVECVATRCSKKTHGCENCKRKVSAKKHVSHCADLFQTISFMIFKYKSISDRNCNIYEIAFSRLQQKKKKTPRQSTAIDS